MLTGKTFLLTGASGGLGIAIARTLLSQEARVVLQGHQRLETIQALMSAFPPEQTHVVQSNLAQVGDAHLLWRDALAWAGHLDGVINNAGFMAVAGVQSEYETWQKAWRDTLQVNLISAADLSYAAIRYALEAQRSCTLVHIASRAAHRGDGPDYTHYAASKAGLVALSKTIACAYAASSILSYVIAPGFIDNEKTARVIANRGWEAVTADIPMGSPVPPQEIANLTAFLLSGAVTHATGSTFDLNGASWVR